MVPAPAAPVRIRTQTAASQGFLRPGWTRAPALAATHNSPEPSSSAPRSMPSPWTTNEAFISQCSGEHTSRPS